MVAALTPDVVIMDIEIPGLNGVEAARRIKANDPGV
jgi:CheY-like chemotaxis protein